MNGSHKICVKRCNLLNVATLRKITSWKIVGASFKSNFIFLKTTQKY